MLSGGHLAWSWWHGYRLVASSGGIVDDLQVRKPEDILRHPSGRGGLSDTQKRILLAVVYYLAVVAALVINHWFSFKVGASSIIILVALIAPLIVGRLSSFEYGGVKVQLRELHQEVTVAKEQISRDVSDARAEINSKIER